MNYWALGPNNVQHRLYTGVAVAYEEEDAVGVFDLLDYIIQYQKLRTRNKNPTLLPHIYYQHDDPIEPAKFLEYLKGMSIAFEGILPDCVLVRFSNDDRIFFEKYVAYLKKKLTNKNGGGEIIDEGHQLFPVYDFLHAIQWEFFPPRETMN